MVIATLRDDPIALAEKHTADGKCTDGNTNQCDRLDDGFSVLQDSLWNIAKGSINCLRSKIL